MYRSISSDIGFNALDTIDTDIRRAHNATDNKVLNTIRCYIDAFNYLSITNERGALYYCRAIETLELIYKTAESAADISTRKATDLATEIADTLYSQTGDYINNPRNITEKAYRKVYALAKQWSDMKPRRKADLTKFNQRVDVAIPKEVDALAASYTSYKRIELCRDAISSFTPMNTERFRTADESISALHLISNVQHRCIAMVREMVEYALSLPHAADSIGSRLSYGAVSAVMKAKFSVTDVAAIEDAYVFYVECKTTSIRCSDLPAIDI